MKVCDRCNAEAKNAEAKVESGTFSISGGGQFDCKIEYEMCENCRRNVFGRVLACWKHSFAKSPDTGLLYAIDMLPARAGWTRMPFLSALASRSFRAWLLGWAMGILLAPFIYKLTFPIFDFIANRLQH